MALIADDSCMDFFGGDVGFGESLARPTTAGERSVIVFLLTAVFAVLGMIALYRGFTVPFNPEHPNEARNLFITGGCTLGGAVLIWFFGRAFVRRFNG